jgi:hypothetical protein
VRISCADQSISTSGERSRTSAPLPLAFWGGTTAVNFGYLPDHDYPWSRAGAISNSGQIAGTSLTICKVTATECLRIFGPINLGQSNIDRLRGLLCMRAAARGQRVAVSDADDAAIAIRG